MKQEVFYTLQTGAIAHVAASGIADINKHYYLVLGIAKRMYDRSYGTIGSGEPGIDSFGGNPATFLLLFIDDE